MNLRKQITGIFACIGMLILILDGQTALSGASAGLYLCLKTVIPSLFPFLFLCSMLTNTLWGSQIPWTNKIGNRLGIPAGAEPILISAVLGGYPAGAQIIGSAYQNGNLVKEDAHHLMTFCSNAGPAFLFGMTAAMFPEKTTVWALWAIQLLSAVLTAISGRHIPQSTAYLSSADPSITDVLTQTIKVMTTICGWVLLFRIVSAFLERWVLFLIPLEIQILITGLLELSNGCICLNQIDSIPIRFIVCSLFLSFGGLCVTMQTISVIGKLSPIPYLTGKLMQTCFSLLLSVLYLQLGWMSLVISCIAFYFLPVHVKKRGGFPSVHSV